MKLGQFTQSSNTWKTGRDTAAHAFTALLAGGGVRARTGIRSDDAGRRVRGRPPVTPADLTATILYHLGSTRPWSMRTSSSTCGTG